MPTQNKYQDVALFALRIITAATFLVAAYYKLSFWSGTPEGMTDGMANLMKFLSIVEALGAIALVIGYLTRLASLGLGIIMVGAIFIMQFVMKIGFVTQTGAGWNFPLVVLGCCLILMAFGPGKLSFDLRRGKEE